MTDTQSYVVSKLNDNSIATKLFNSASSVIDGFGLDKNSYIEQHVNSVEDDGDADKIFERTLNSMKSELDTVLTKLIEGRENI